MSTYKSLANRWSFNEDLLKRIHFLHERAKTMKNMINISIILSKKTKVDIKKFLLQNH